MKLSPLARLHATAKRGKPLLEKHVQRQIVDYLRLIGCHVYVLGTVRRKGDHPGTMQTPGIPDLWAFVPAARDGGVWIEVKRKGGTRSQAQQEFAARCFETGTYYVCGDLDDVQSWMRDMGWAR